MDATRRLSALDPDQGAFVPPGPQTGAFAPGGEQDVSLLHLDHHRAGPARVYPLDPARNKGETRMAVNNNRNNNRPPKRQREVLMAFRASAQERAAIRANADRAGLAVGAFIRAATTGDAGPRAQRRPPADHMALRQILGHCGRIGNNVNQIAHQLNAGRPVNVPELREALRAYLDIRNAIFTALGMTTMELPRDRQGKQPRRS